MTIFTQFGTAKMVVDSDPMPVIDERLRSGIGGLRVVKASIMPTITSDDTNSPTSASAN